MDSRNVRRGVHSDTQVSAAVPQNLRSVSACPRSGTGSCCEQRRRDGKELQMSAERHVSSPANDARRQNPLHALTALGQSIWIDHLDRARITSGAVARLVADDGVRGMTSNPSIFEKAIAGDQAYDGTIRALALQGKSSAEIYEAVTVKDIQLAADVLRPVFDRLDGSDGFVSLEVSPRLAYDTRATIAEARRLWAAVDRPNAMIKVPATREGLPAIEVLTGDQINVNVTLLFGLGRYQEVAEAYLAGLESLAARSKSVRVASVASFFLSRIDVRVDAELEERERGGGLRPELASHLRGKAAIASARMAYQLYAKMVADRRFKALAARGARPQRLLWASTSTKNPAYSDVKYVEALIGADTINTVPLETLDAYRDHGKPERRLGLDTSVAARLLDQLAEAGIRLGDVTQELEYEGVRKFVDAYDRLLLRIARRRAAALDASGGEA